MEPDRSPMTVRCMHISCGMPNATNTLSEYVILIAIPLLKLLLKRSSILRYST